MEIGNYIQRVLQRIQKVEPENATKIFGYLLLRHSLEELMGYAVGDEEQMHSLIAEAKFYLLPSLKLKPSEHLHPLASFNRIPHLSFSSHSNLRAPAPRHQDHISCNNEVWGMEDQLQPLSPSSFDLQGDNYLLDCGFGLSGQSQLSCHHFYNDYCRHGLRCNFSPGHSYSDSITQMPGVSLNELTMEDNMIFSVCLEKLELEIGEILKARRGLPVTIASLPILYQEMYGKALQANGYHTESQRHAKAGFSLTTLLAQLRNIRLMERPHGQHFVVLVEDAPKYMEVRGERNEYGASSSHQIYLTFPAESTFTDAEVQNYFNQFGPVHDVRIPRQEKRMFGFVSFYHPQTARKILAMGHPHIIGGARVLVKPYKEKSRLVERKQADKVDAQKCPSSFSFDMDKDLVSRQISCDTSKLHIKQQIEDLQPVFDLKTRHFLEHQLRQMPLVYGLEEPEILEDQFNSLNITSFNSTDDDSTLEPGGNCSDPDRLQIELPDSPFTSPRFGSNGLYMVA